MRFYEGAILPDIKEDYTRRTGLRPPEPDEQFAAVRARLDVSQAAMARFFGVSPATYGRWELRDVSLAVVAEGALRALAQEVEEIIAEGDEERAKALIEEGISDFLARPARSARLDEGRGRKGRLEPPVTKEDVVRLRTDLVGWKQTEMAQFFRVAQSTANSWELETEAIQPIVAGALRALQDEIVYRTWTLVHGEWLAFREDLKKAGVAVFLAERCRGPDWWPKPTSDQGAHA